MIDISASIVLYKSSDEVRSCIEGFLDTTLSVRLFLVDNSPTDELQYLAQDERISYIYTGANLGYGRAHNIAIKRAEGLSRYHLILNPDIHIPKGTLDELLAYMEANPEVGHVMPKVYYPNGDVQYLAKLLPSPVDLIFKRFIPNAWIASRLDKFQLKFTEYDQVMDAPYLSGCFMLMRTKVLQEVGGFDGRFFMYGEDTDLSRRVHLKYRTVFYPYVHVVHQHEQASYKSFKMLWIHIVNLSRYFSKWGWFFDADRKRINRETIAKISKNQSMSIV